MMRDGTGSLRHSTESVDEAFADYVPEILAPGTVFAARYEIGRVLGIGGYAVVYEALDRRLATSVAIKVLRTDRVNASAIRRFRREVLVARGAESPHLLRLYDIGDHDGTLYITMELVDGSSLREVMRGGPLSVDRVIDIAADVARALEALHQLSIVHRDVKPENILIAKNGTVKLADFGLARFTDDATQTNTLVGTFEYLSPEQALGKAIGPTSDLYSLGVLLFEMLTGSLPYASDSSIGALLAHVHQRPRSLRRLRPDAPRWLTRLVVRLLTKQAEGRYPSAAALRRDLEQRRASWGWHQLRGAAMRTLIGLGAAAAIASGVWAWTDYRDSRFAAIVTGQNGMRGVDRLGRTLWSADRTSITTHAIARILPEGRRVAIAFPFPVEENSTAPVRGVVIDLQSGERLRTIEFPSRTHFFPSFSNTYFCSSVIAADVDGDGWDELIAAIAHNPYWPSYSIMYDGGTGAFRDLFVASGRHDPVGIMDVDGDGKNEVIYVGPSNRLGWYTGVAAVRVTHDVGRGLNYAFTPDVARPVAPSETLVWYALFPAGGHQIAQTTLDTARRQIHLNYPDGTRIIVNGDGFPTDAPPRSPEDRRAGRNASYEALRNATRTLESGDAETAVRHSDVAVAQATRAGDRTLAEWAARVRVRALIAAGRLRDAELALADLPAHPADASNAAFDAARAYHITGHTDEAVQWYRRGYVRGDQLGRLKWEYLLGLVLALTEQSRFAESAQEIERYASAFPEDLEPSWCRRFVQWRESGRVSLDPRLERVTDVHFYWDIEFRLANNENGDTLLREVEALLRTTSEVTPLLHSVKAELLARRGARVEARILALQALREAEALARTDTVIRSHTPIVRERAERLGR